MLDHYEPDGQVDLVGHSMGANVICLYAGIRPQRVRRVVDLEGFGMTATRPVHAPKRYARWLDELRTGSELKTYDSVDGVAARLQKTNPRLPDDRAAFLAEHWSRRNAEGRWEILGDPAHKLVNPMLYRLDEVMAIWEQVSAPVLHVEARDSETLRNIAHKQAIDEFKERFRAFRDFREAVVDDASRPARRRGGAGGIVLRRGVSAGAAAQACVSFSFSAALLLVCTCTSAFSGKA